MYKHRILGLVMPIQRPRANNNNGFQKINNNHNRADIIVKIRLKLKMNFKKPT